jgi:O-antigen/teichoic acid export membrane protein
MSKAVKRVVKNSFLQTFGSLGVTALNFVLSIGYAKFLGPEYYGALVTAQAQVLVWTILVDLGLSHSLIGTLTAAENQRTEISRQGFRTRDLLYRVLFIRLCGGALGAGIIFLIATTHSSPGTPRFWQDIAFTPHLFGFVLQQTAMSLAMYRHRQGLAVGAYVFGVAVSVVAALVLAAQGAPVSWLLLAQASGGFLTGGILFGFFFFAAMGKKRRGDTRRRERSRGGWGKLAWRALARDAWPYAITSAALVLWQRLDQLAASHFLGLEAGGQYGLAVRLVGTPLLVATSVCFAIFPDLQRIGLDAPERVKVILAMVLKVIWRYGILLAGIILVVLAAIIVPLVPRFLPAIKLLPFFVPGIWAFWMQSFLVNALFGLRQYRLVVRAHLFAICSYGVLLPLLTINFKLHGVVWSFNIFCFAMVFFTFRAAKRCGLLRAGFLPWHAYTDPERQLLRKAMAGRGAARGAGA